ncbi:DUF969 domain-containing protein [Aliivibrio fischeri]|uniref:DUF969 family protein n=2 Tax=Aliivibrio fischeri TaxID=668 RepID=A0A6I3YFM5_ALIFS|nr:MULTISPECIES: DUF969 domain-containing protein [Aliivibrio]EHN69785.1 permease [Aliivibrio fischeri SR5]MBD1569827.1 DUF969 domain-containing protein [Aliivibrio sp. S10_S31]MBP3141947.1 DUF969 domain-containing protein [Aliivibrio fischeri]MBP3157423.1 DUF969 domain-containing protein [Aliivibrio fischeri]MCE4934500.1 DUF969 domain-containing protein [Aliivibrio fischeri]
MIDFWPLIGVLIITVGLALRLNTLLVILTAGIVTGLVAKIDFIEILSILGASFTQNRYMSLFILVLPMIGVLERFGLRERAETLIGSIKQASAGRVMLTYLLLRKVTNALGLNLGGHPSMIRPLVAPMAEAAAEKGRKPLTNKEKQHLRALAAMSENFANFFSQLIFIGAGGLLLIKGVLEEHGYSVALNDMFMWAIPTALASCVVFYVRAWIEDSRLAKAGKQE